jgi:basic amino acid/polyamine antiporter, APA family
MNATSESKTDVVRGLGLLAAISINVANMIGTGVFLKTRVMTCNVGEPWLVLAAWGLAGLLSMAGALTYAELAALMPRSGGGYVFLKEAYGRPVGFIYAWTLFVAARTGSQAALAVGSAIFLNILAGGWLNGPWMVLPVAGHVLSISKVQMAALFFIILVTLINCGAIVLSGRIAMGLTLVKVVSLMGVSFCAYWLWHGHWANLSLTGMAGTCEAVPLSARGGWAGFGAAMVGALWAYDGWDNVTSVAGEVKNPQRNLPRAFIAAMLLVGSLYLIINGGYFFVLTPVEIASVPLDSSVATEVIGRILGPAAVSIMAGVLLISSFGALYASILANSRVPFALAQDGLFFRKLAAISPHSRVPVRALLAQGAWAGVLTLAGTYDTLTDCVIFASWLLYGLTAASIFVFRRRFPAVPRPYRTWGYPIVPLLFLVVTGWLLLNSLIATPRQALSGLSLIALGLPFYWYWSRQNQEAGQ